MFLRKVFAGPAGRGQHAHQRRDRLFTVALRKDREGQISQMYCFALGAKPVIERQSAENVEPATRTGKQDRFGRFELFEKWNCHMEPTLSFLTKLVNSESIPSRRASTCNQ